VRLRATVRKRNGLCRSRFALWSGPAEPGQPEEENGCRSPRCSRPPGGGGRGVGAGGARAAPVTAGRGGGEWAWGLKWRRQRWRGLFNSSYRLGPPGVGGGCCFSPLGVPVRCPENRGVPLPPPALARVRAGLRRARTWRWDGGRVGAAVRLRGGGGVSPVSGVRRITLFIPVHGLSGEGG